MASEVNRQRGCPKAFAPRQPSSSQYSYSVRFGDSLWLPFKGELPHIVRTLLDRGERRIVLDLARVSRIDAAGIGDLVRAYNIAFATNGAVRVVNTNPWIREMLKRVGLFDRLNTGPNDMKDHAICAIGRTPQKVAWQPRAGGM